MRRNIWLAAGLFAGVALGAYMLTSLASDNPSGRADPATSPTASSGEEETPAATPDTTATAAYWEMPGEEVTPEPGSTPDRSRPWWHIAYINQDQMDEPFVGDLNGFRIELTDDNNQQICEQPEWDDSIVSEGTAMDVFPGWLPAGTIAQHGGLAVFCDGTIVLAHATFSVPAEPPDGRLGGTIRVSRALADPVLWAGPVPAGRWEADTFAGLPAVFAHPILEDIGLGDSAVAVNNPSTGIVTVLLARGIPFAELMRIAESLVE